MVYRTLGRECALHVGDGKVWDDQSSARPESGPPVSGPLAADDPLASLAQLAQDRKLKVFIDDGGGVLVRTVFRVYEPPCDDMDDDNPSWPPRYVGPAWLNGGWEREWEYWDPFDDDIRLILAEFDPLNDPFDVLTGVCNVVKRLKEPGTSLEGVLEAELGRDWRDLEWIEVWDSEDWAAWQAGNRAAWAAEYWTVEPGFVYMTPLRADGYSPEGIPRFYEVVAVNRKTVKVRELGVDFEFADREAGGVALLNVAPRPKDYLEDSLTVEDNAKGKNCRMNMYGVIHLDRRRRLWKWDGKPFDCWTRRSLI